MIAHVLLNLLNELRKRDKMRGLQSILSLFYEYNKFNNTGAQMFDSFDHMTLILLNQSHFGVKMQDFAIFYAKLKWTSLRNITKSVNHLWFVDFIAWCYITSRRDIM